MSGTTKKFLVDNFANIAIALSVVFLVFELTQNRRMMERELIFMEAQAYQGARELAMELNLETMGDRDLIELTLRAKREGLSNMTEVERQVLFNYFNTRRILIGNLFYQTQLGLLDREHFDEVGRKAIERDGELIVALEIPMNPAFREEVDFILAEMHRSAARG